LGFNSVKEEEERGPHQMEELDTSHAVPQILPQSP